MSLRPCVYSTAKTTCAWCSAQSILLGLMCVAVLTACSLMCYKTRCNTTFTCHYNEMFIPCRVSSVCKNSWLMCHQTCHYNEMLMPCRVSSVYKNSCTVSCTRRGKQFMFETLSRPNTTCTSICNFLFYGLVCTWLTQ